MFDFCIFGTKYHTATELTKFVENVTIIRHKKFELPISYFTKDIASRTWSQNLHMHANFAFHRVPCLGTIFSITECDKF